MLLLKRLHKRLKFLLTLLFLLLALMAITPVGVYALGAFFPLGDVSCGGAANAIQHSTTTIGTTTQFLSLSFLQVSAASLLAIFSFRYRSLKRNNKPKIISITPSTPPPRGK